MTQGIENNILKAKNLHVIEISHILAKVFKLLTLKTNKT